MRQFVLLYALALGACGGPLASTPLGDDPVGSPPAQPGAGQPTALPDAGAPAPPDAGQPSVAPPAPATPSGPTLAGCPMFTATSEWNRDVSGDSVDPNSEMWMASMGSGSLKLHADFGSNPLYGIPFEIVRESQTRQPMQFLYWSQSEPGPYPFPPDVPIQGGQDAGGDRHAVVLDADRCLLYETYDTHWLGDGQGYRAGSGAVFDLRSDALRSDGWTSATASGLPILPGLARYDEVAVAGAVLHALTFTAGGGAAHAWVHPGTHWGESGASNAPPMAIRVRLKSGFDVSAFHGMSRTILLALQRYGMFLVDEAYSDFVAISGASDARWNDQDLDQLKTVPFSAFEVVKTGTVHSR